MVVKGEALVVKGEALVVKGDIGKGSKFFGGRVRTVVHHHHRVEPFHFEATVSWTAISCTSYAHRHSWSFVVEEKVISSLVAVALVA